jgi:glutamyl-tRNA synthetase
MAEEVKRDQIYQRFSKALKGAVQGQVVTRFPPEPSGFLHIGHVKAAMLNYHYSKIYGGRMLLRFDDTNPTKETAEFLDSIKHDLNLLQIFPDSVSSTSDHFGLLQDYMERMIANGDAYLDNTPVERMREERDVGTESTCRSQSVEENLAIWRRFVAGEAAEYCVRAKMFMTSKNKCLRDPVFYRFNATPHLKTGSTHQVYPTYDFACPIVDSVEGVTHALRTSEYNDRNDMYKWVQEKLELRKVNISDFSRLNFVHTVLSKRKLQKLVDTGVVDGWSDPRFPTVQGIIRRGMQAQTLKEFMLEQGNSKATVFMDWSALWSKNKKILDPIAPRYTALSMESLCILELENGPEHATAQQHGLHQKNAALGSKEVHYFNRVLLELADAETVQPGEKITLLKWGNVVVSTVGQTDETFQGATVHLKLVGRLALDDTNYTGTKKFTWLPALEHGLVPITLVEFDHLITKAKVEETDDFDSIVNVNSKFTTAALGEPALAGVAANVTIQLERKSFFIVDRTSPFELIAIPDGSHKEIVPGSSKVDPKALAQGTQVVESDRVKARKAKKEKQLKAAVDASAAPGPDS